VREEFAKQYNIRTSMSEAEITSDQRKRRFEYDENDADKRKKEKRYPCEDAYLTKDERRNEVYGCVCVFMCLCVYVWVRVYLWIATCLKFARALVQSLSMTSWWMATLLGTWSACGTFVPRIGWCCMSVLSACSLPQ
jgi:hypothetical protein